MLRRHLLTLALPAVALAACTTTSDGGKKTITIDTSRVHTDGTAILQALTAILAAPSIAVVLGPNYVTAQAALAAAQAALAAFDSLTNGSVSASIDTMNAQSIVTSLVTDAQTVLTLVQSALLKIPAGAVATQVGNYVAAVLTLLPFISLAVGLSGGAKLAKPLMSESQALAVAGR